MTDISYYLDFVLTLFFAFGIAFEIPIATILLVAAGITTPQDLARKRPYVIVGVFVAGMLLTPPDVISQTLLALPMWILFELGIVFSRVFQQRRKASGNARDSQAVSGAAAGLATATAGSNVERTDNRASSVGKPAAKSGGDGDVVGRDISGGDPFESGRFTPMNEEEMEAQLDAVESDEQIDSEALDEQDPVEQKLERIMALRELEDYPHARRLLYEVLEEGDDEQRRVARNILEQLDTP